MRILLIEKDEDLCSLIGYRFAADRMRVDIETNLEEALVADRVTKYDAVIYGLSHSATIVALANRKRPLMVLVEVRERDFSTEVVKVLGSGADDCMLKPADLAELTARMRALIRRYNGHAFSTIEAGNMTLDLDNQTVHIDRQFIHMTPRCYKVIECLMLRQGRTVTKEALLDYVYGGRDEPEQKILDVFMCQLRAKLRKAKVPIETVWGRGWRIEA